MTFFYGEITSINEIFLLQNSRYFILDYGTHFSFLNNLFHIVTA
ncbi:hypothetical protein protein [Bacillus cereus G9241]|nr:hypothetical protein protein [Bacillus cereus G9241]